MIDRLPSIASLLPHSGTMVMPESIEFVDDARIVCTSSRHRSVDNPLRRAGRLPVLCGIEFAAQAMALHGALRRAPPSALRDGRLASVRDVVAGCRFLDEVAGALVIECRLVAAAAGARSYTFTLKTVNDGGDALLQGRATVMLAQGKLA